MIRTVLCLAIFGGFLGYVHPLSLKSEGSCECSLYLRDNQGKPRYPVMSLTNDLSLNCANLAMAKTTCQEYCSDELSTLNLLYEMDRSILDGYSLSQNLPCNSEPMHTTSFFTFCGVKSRELSSEEKGPPICCLIPKKTINWCGSNEYPEHAPVDNLLEARELNLKVDQNDESQNEILDTPVVEDKKSNKTKILKPVLTSHSTFMQRIIKYFGYKSIGDAIKSIDIFSLPGKVQGAFKTYRDEMAMGRCYMEFTTFKLFTKQENPFEGLLRRKKRDVDMAEEVEANTSEDLSRALGLETVNEVIDEVARMFDGPEGRQYADLIKTFLPIVTQALGGSQGPNPAASNSPSTLSALLRLASPFMLQMANSRPTSVHEKLGNNNYNTIQKTPSKITSQPLGSANASPMTSLLMSLAGNALSSMFTAPTRNTIPSASNPSSNPSPQITPGAYPNNSGLSTLLKMFLGGMTNRQPPTPRPTAKPVTIAQKVTDQEKREQDEKRFIDMVLELVRPVFISILGSTPGESGVKAIRKASTQSTLGRVDDSQREEVNSPLFCFKRYVVNKAWTFTETGVRTILSKFSPEERFRMMERML